jgi:hypothetical protein
MSASMPLGGSSTYAPPADATEALQRIDRSTQEMVRWVKILVVAVVILILVNLAFFV